jgi:hypothetical protein
MAEIAVSTRVALGIGIGLLIARGLSKDASKAAGLALTVVGGLTTIPFIVSAVSVGSPTCARLGPLRKTRSNQPFVVGDLRGLPGF